MLNPGIKQALLRFGWRRAAHSPHALDLCWHCAVRSPFHVYDEARDLEAEVIHTFADFTAVTPARITRPPTDIISARAQQQNRNEVA